MVERYLYYREEEKILMDVLTKFSDFNEWKIKNEGFTIFNYLTIKTTPLQIYLAGKLFFPELIFDGKYIFIKDSPQFKFLDDCKNKNMSDNSIEKYINSIMLECLFPNSSEYNEKFFKELAGLIEKSWKLHFANAYPNIKIEVEKYNDEFDGWCVTCYNKS